MSSQTRRAILEWDREKERHTKKTQQGKEVKNPWPELKISRLLLCMKDYPVMMNRWANPTASRTRRCTWRSTARHHGLRNIRHFWDDGYTGTNFNRPGFNALLSEIEAGHVATLIVKDLSRFGAKLLAGGLLYRGRVPPRRASASSPSTTAWTAQSPSDNDFTPFLNIMNEWYAKDTSNKIKAVFKAPDEERNAVQRLYPLWLQADQRGQTAASCG